MSARQFWDWIGYAELEPFDLTRFDLHAAMITAAIYNARFASKNKPLPFKMHDFLLDFNKEAKSGARKPGQPMDWRMMKEISKMWVAASKGK